MTSLTLFTSLTVFALAVAGSPPQEVPRARIADSARIVSVVMTAAPSERPRATRTDQVVDYDVELTYRFDRPIDRTAVSALGLDGVELQGIAVRIGARDAPIAWSRMGTEAGAAAYWAGESGPLDVEDTSLTVRYTATGAFHEGSALTLPVAVAGGLPPEALPGAFAGRITLPSVSGGLHVRRAFPSDVTEDVEGDARVVVASLPIVPRMLRLELGSGDGSRWSRIDPMEALATILILFFGALGWRHLRRSV